MKKYICAAVLLSISAVSAMAFDPLFDPALTYGAGDQPWTVATGDFDEDGHTDLAVANNSSGNISILLGLGDGTFASAASCVAENPFSVVAGDFNEDGHLDLAVSSENWSDVNVSILLGLGDGTFSSGTNYDTGSAMSRHIALGDFDEDGHVDLAVAHWGSGAVSILLGLGDGTFGLDANYYATAGATPVITGDFNEDGHADLAVGGDLGDNVSILLGIGDGTFAPYVSYGTGDACFSVTHGDFNEDGHADLAAANSISNDISILLGLGDGTFTSASSCSAGSYPRSVAVGDFDRDGHIDVAAANMESDDISILLGLGDGTFAPAVSYGSGDGAWSIATGDFDENRDIDLAVTNSFSDNVSIFINHLEPSPFIASIADIPNDQGRQVSITWMRSGYDYMGSATLIAEYAIYRKIDYDLVSELGLEVSKLDRISATCARELNVSSLAYPPGDWHFLMIVPARCEDTYATVVPTLADSTIAEGMYYTTFFVSAMTETTSIYFDSAPDSGYSVDNLSPHIPEGFSVAYNTEYGNELSWDESVDEDFNYFCIYRDVNDGFIHTPENLVHTTTGAGWLDMVEDGWQYNYEITAVDFSGNESPAALPEQVTGDDGSTIPTSFTLYQNVPNPFNPVTVIRFHLPRALHVKLCIYNIRGELLSTLADSYMVGGEKEISWSGKDDMGRRVASGIYFCCLSAGDFMQAKKMVLLR